MDVNALMQAVGTVGFPIVCAIGMGWYIKYSTDRNREDIAKLNEQHKNEMSDVTVALNNNTLAIQHLCDMLSKGDDKSDNS
nr:MAG TPA: YvrJ protein family protein [Bacteriophage sp.]